MFDIYSNVYLLHHLPKVVLAQGRANEDSLF